MVDRRGIGPSDCCRATGPVTLADGLWRQRPGRSYADLGASESRRPGLRIPRKQPLRQPV